jgi:hypothetical protein
LFCKDEPAKKSMTDSTVIDWYSTEFVSHNKPQC